MTKNSFFVFFALKNSIEIIIINSSLNYRCTSKNINDRVISIKGLKLVE